jgi:hypothetical protein
MPGRCPVRGCPTAAGACTFHGRRYPKGYDATDRLIRQRPSDAERGGSR